MPEKIYLTDSAAGIYAHQFAFEILSASAELPELLWEDAKILLSGPSEEFYSEAANKLEDTPILIGKKTYRLISDDNALGLYLEEITD